MKNYRVMDPGSGALQVGTANLVQAPINKWHVAERRLKARARLEAHEIKTPKTWPHVPVRSRLDGDRKTWDQRLICVINLAKEQWDLVFFYFFLEEKERTEFILVWKLCEKIWPWINEHEFLNGSDTM